MGGPPLFFCQSFGSCTRFFCYRKDAGDMEHSTEILYNRTAVYCSAEHRFGSDALLLSRFCAPKRAEAAVDLCSGCGIVALAWHDAGHRGRVPPWSCSPRPAPCCRQRWPTRTSGISSRSAPTCAPFAQQPGQWDVCAATRPILPRALPPTAPPGPWPGTRRAVGWRMCAAAGSGCCGTGASWLCATGGASGRGAGRFAGGTAGA